MPTAAREWLGYRVFSAASDFAQQLLEGEARLEGLNLYTPNPFSLSPVTRVVLNDLLNRIKPSRVLELGSGVSTLISAASLAQWGPTNSKFVYSIDHDESWLEVTRGLLTRAGLDGFVRLIHAPLQERNVYGETYTTYDLPEKVLLEAGAKGFDLCLIDGPPRQVGRTSCLPLVASFLASNATILLDDAYRAGEQAAWAAWRRSYPRQLHSTQLLLTDRGMLSGSWHKA